MDGLICLQTEIAVYIVSYLDIWILGTSVSRKSVRINLVVICNCDIDQKRTGKCINGMEFSHSKERSTNFLYPKLESVP